MLQSPLKILPQFKSTIHSTSSIKTFQFSSSLPIQSSKIIKRMSSSTISNPISSNSESKAIGQSIRPVVLCGPSGVGKSTLIKKLDAEFPGRFGFSVSHTTRSPRPGEIPGISYHYVTRDEFLKLVSEGAFLENAEFGGNLYGTSAKAVDDVSQGEVDTPEGKIRRRALLDIDAQGVRLIKANHPNLNPIYIFISPPSFSDLKNRLISRGTETSETISKRLSFSSREMSYARSGAFDAIVVNDDLERSYKVLKNLILNDAREGIERDELPEKEKEEEEWKE